MPSDIINAETFAEHLASLKSAEAAAERECDAAALRFETGNGSEADIRDAQANLQDIRNRIDAATRARQLSKIEEDRREQEWLSAERSKGIAKAIAKAAAVQESADSLQSAVEAIIERAIHYAAAQADFEEVLRPLIDKSRTRIVTDALAHHFEGACIVGQLQKAGLPGMHHLNDMSPIEAMRAFEGQNVAEIVRGRLAFILRLSRPDLTPAEEGKE